MRAENAAASARDIYRCHRSFEKAVAIDGKRETYLTGDTTVDYAEVKDQTLLYRITLVTSADESGEIVFEDTLPEGTAWGKGSDKNRLFVDGVQQNWYNGGWQITSAPDAANGNLLKVSVQGCDDSLQLKDKAEIKRGESFYGSNVRLYYYEPSSEKLEDVSGLQAVEEGRCHIDEPEADYWLCMTIPDNTALLLRYEMEFDPGDYESPKLSNTVYPGYELPSTGGRGTAPFVLAGGIMVLGAALLLACGRVRRRKEETK